MQTLQAKEKSEESGWVRRFRKSSVPKLGKAVVYPDSDGKPMSDNTEQFDWIVKIKENLEQIFADNPDVFVAGDLLWYPAEGNPKIRIAPDAMVAFGRPKGYRGSYRMWEEGNVAPQVVFEILSPGNRRKEMEEKLGFYEKYGVSEYYVYDPDRILLTGYIRENNRLCPIENMQGWTSPLLKIRFEPGQDDLYIYRPDGEKFLSPLETDRLRRSAQSEAEAERRKAISARTEAESERRKAVLAELEAASERQKAASERQKAASAEQKAEAEYLRAERLAAKLRELGIENGY
jgi:Uma2 family endonuclease